MTNFDLIREWAGDKGIYSKGDLKTQTLKLVEESGELAKAVLQNDRDEVIDAIGDCVVVLTSIAELADLHFTCNECDGSGTTMMGTYLVKCESCEGRITIEKCIASAYEVISKRKGKMDNGTFKKEL
jgi:hypothetical protein